MAHIVCLTSGLTGILHASFELVKRLTDYGHQVSYGCPVDVAEKVKAQGINYVQLPSLAIDPEPEVPEFKGPLKKWKRWVHKVRHRKQRQQLALEALKINDIEEGLEGFEADLFIIDIELHEYIISAQSRQFPFVLLSQWFSLWKSPGLPYLLHDIIPGVGWKGSRPGIELAWMGVILRRSWMFAKKKYLSVGTDRRSTLLKLAERLNFPMGIIKENYWPGPFSYRSLPVMSMTAWEMELPHKKRENLHYIGPMVEVERKDIAVDNQVRERLAKIIKQKHQSGSFLIYCSVSSLKKGDQNFLQKVCTAVSKEPNWMLVLGMGGLLDTDFLEPVAANIYPFSWLPQLEILAQADCSINHGGIHTINECIHFKVPMLVYSGKRSDQNGCAARVAYHRLGLVGDKDRDSSEVIHQKIGNILSEKSFQQEVDRMHRHGLQYKKENSLEKLIDNFLC